MEYTLYKNLLKLIDMNLSIEEMCEILNIDIITLKILIDDIRKNGDLKNENIDKITRIRPKPNNEIFNITDDSECIKIALIGDTHLALKRDDIDLLNKIYDEFEKKRVNYVFHCGDFTEGLSYRKKHRTSHLKEATYEGQLEYSIANYPMYSGKTYVISGNHDDWWYLINNKEIIRDISKERDDIVYLGALYRNIDLANIKIQIVHGDINPITGRKLKQPGYVLGLKEMPDIMHFGHIHKHLYEVIKKTECFRTSSLCEPRDERDIERIIFWLNIYKDDNGKIKKIDKKMQCF